MLDNQNKITKRRLTDAQRRAIEWLPANGTWKINPGRLAAALSSLSIAWQGCVECEWGKFGLRAGRCQRWRLNSLGVELREALNQSRCESDTTL